MPRRQAGRQEAALRGSGEGFPVAQPVSERSFDVAVVGAGIVGLAHALAAARHGKRVIVIDRDAQANGASIRNFGFVTVTGQQQGECWRRAMRSRDVWLEVAEQAGIAIEQEGLCVAARRSEARRVLEAFLATEMGAGCRLLSPIEAAAHVPGLRQSALSAALWSPHERRVESRTAIPRLARWLEERMEVTFLRSALVKAVEPPRIETTQGPVLAETAIVCPGHDLQSLFADRIAAYGLTTCKLHMLRLAPADPAFRLGAAVMSDLGLVRYLGYAELAEAAALKSRLMAEERAALDSGVHLIAVQSADGSLVVGDSHHYGETLDPFAPEAVDELILGELDAVLDIPGRSARERWVGVYASAADRLMLVDRPSDAVRIVIVTSGTGASTAFAIGEEVVAELFGPRH
jgi:FAD dependent oxidoreductase TIGR03364